MYTACLQGYKVTLNSTGMKTDLSVHQDRGLKQFDLQTIHWLSTNITSKLLEKEKFLSKHDTELDSPMVGLGMMNLTPPYTRCKQ